jgi:hypothetical protein
MNYISGVWRHGSETILSFYSDSNSNIKKICKSSTTSKGLYSIESEINGFNWYNKRSNNKIHYSYGIKRDNYALITIYPNCGFYKPTTKILEENIYMFTDIMVEHYIRIWFNYKNSKYSPLHGDLSLIGNVLFNRSNEAIFIDWEHFKEDSGMPTGFDPLMIMFENMYFEHKKTKKISLKTIKNTVYLINKIKSEKLLSDIFFRNPLQSTINVIKNNSLIWNGQHFKLPILKISPEIIFNIDSILNSRLGYS